MLDPAPTRKCRPQVAALPVRLRDGAIEVMLITSRETRRWIIPKGWLKKGAAPHAMAAREAFEEAGLIGTASKRPVGTYRYEKRLLSTETVPCEVSVFVVEVERQAEDWPERTQRRQRWLPPETAARLIAEAGLAALLRRLAGVAHRPGKLTAALRAGGKSGRAKSPAGKTARGRRKAAARPDADSGELRRRRSEKLTKREKRDLPQHG